MSYLNRLQQNQSSLESQRQYLPDFSSGLTPLPSDQSQNIMGDKARLYQDSVAENATSPFTAIGATDLVRRGVKTIPAVKDISDLYNQSSEFRDRIGALMSDDGFQSLLSNPEKALNSLSQASRDKISNAISDGISQLKQAGIQKIGELNVPDIGEAINSISKSIPSAEEASSIVGQSIAKGVKTSLIGDNSIPSVSDVGSAVYNSIFGQDPVSTEERVAQTTDFQDSEPARAIDDGEDNFVDTFSGEPTDFAGARAVRLAKTAQLKDSIMKNLQDLKSSQPGDIEGGSGEQLDAQKQLGELSQPDTSQESDQLGKIQGEAKNSENLSLDEAENADKLAGADVVENAGLDAGGEDAVETAGLAVGDAIPGIGTLADLASIGAIIGEAVKTGQDKSSLEKAGQIEKQRQMAIQQDISEQQNEIIGEGRQEIAQQQRQSQILSQQRQGNNSVPVGQSQVASDK